MIQQYTLASEMFTIEVQVQGAEVTTSHWTHVTEGCNAASHCNHHHWTSMGSAVHNAAIYQCFPLKPLQKLLIVASCITMALVLVLIWSIVVVVVVVCCSMLHPSSTSADACAVCFYQLVPNTYTYSFHFHRGWGGSRLSGH